MPEVTCAPAITDEELPGGNRVVILDDVPVDGTLYILVNRAELLADPEGVWLETLVMIDLNAKRYDRTLKACPIAS